MPEGIALLGGRRHCHRRLERAQLHALGHHDDAEVFAFGASPVQVLDHRVEVDREFGDDDHVGTAGQATHHPDPTGIAPHHLHHHDPVVGGRGRVQPVERFDDDAHRGVETDAELGDGQVVVDRLRNPHHRKPRVTHRRRHRQGIVATDRHQAIDAAAAQQLDDFGDAALFLEGIGPRGAQDGAADWQDAAHRSDRQFLQVTGAEHARPAILDPGHLEAALKGTASHAPNGGIETRRVAAAGENTDAHDA